MSTAATMAAVSATNAAIAAQAAQEAAEAKAISCAALVRGYRHDTATIQESKAYAACIEAMHPNESMLNTIESVVFVKILIVAALLGMIAGAIHGWREGVYGRVGEALFVGLFGLICGPLAVLVLFAILSGIRFLFT